MPKSSEKEAAESVARTLTCDRRPRQTSISPFVRSATKTDYYLTALLLGFFSIAFPPVSHAFSRSVYSGEQTNPAQPPQPRDRKRLAQRQHRQAVAEQLLGYSSVIIWGQPGARPGPSFPPQTGVPFPQDPRKSQGPALAEAECM